MTSLVSAVLGRRFETTVRGLMALSKLQLQQALKSRFPCLPWLRTKPIHDVLTQSSSVVPTFTFTSAGGSSDKLLLFNEQSRDHYGSSGSSGGGDERKSSSFKLMDYKKLRWPSPINAIRNYIFSALIQISFDQEFSMSSFLAGAEQVMQLLNWIHYFVFNIGTDSPHTCNC